MKQSSISQKKLREFGLLIGIGFPLIFGWIIPSISGHLFRFWTLWIGVPLFILGILRPGLLLYPYKVWIKTGNTMGWINNHIILGLVFILVLLPISLIMKILGYDPLKKKKNNVLTFREVKDLHKIDLTRIF